jgi:N-acetylmuramoyl-L-alanine amidase
MHSQNVPVSDSAHALRRTLSQSVCACSVLALLLAGCATVEHDTPTAPSGLEPGNAAEPAPAPAPTVPEPAPVAPAASAVTNLPPEASISLQRWCQWRGFSGLRQIAAAPSPTYAVNTPGGGWVLRAGTRAAHWDGVEVRLGFAPQMLNGQPCLHGVDFTKTLDPLTKSTFLSCPHTNRIIVIDPGHGGADSGTKNVLGLGYEKEFTLDWARRTAAILSTNGWQVFLTRTADVDVPLSSRIAFADTHQADIFLSLHFNSAAPDERQAGLETYCLTPTGMTSTVTRGFEDDPTVTFPNNAFDEQNLQLAALMQRALLQVNGHLDRGVRRARYLGVLRWQNRPAALVEGGYLSNPREARSIASPLYRQHLAEAVARALTAK